MNASPKFQLGDLVCKTKGSHWSGIVVGTYSTALTPEGYAVESSTEKGSVQIYPAAALEKVGEQQASASLLVELERLAQLAGKMEAENLRLRGQVSAAIELGSVCTAHLESYIKLVNSGDCGNWDPELEPQVIALRAALSKWNEANK